MSRLYVVAFWLVISTIIWLTFELNYVIAFWFGLVTVVLIICAGGTIAGVLKWCGWGDTKLFNLALLPAIMLFKPKFFEKEKSITVNINGRMETIVIEQDSECYIVYLADSEIISGSGFSLDQAVQNMVQNNPERFTMLENQSEGGDQLPDW